MLNAGVKNANVMQYESKPAMGDVRVSFLVGLTYGILCEAETEIRRHQVESGDINESDFLCTRRANEGDEVVPVHCTLQMLARIPHAIRVKMRNRICTTATSGNEEE